jgi:hemolysin D
MQIRRPSSDKGIQEFLPAALEIQETPPSPAGRLILWAIMIFFILSILWATIGQVDIVAVAQGKIIPSSRVKVIQPLETGVITAIHVHEDQQVKQGDVLIELDPTSSRADQDRIQAERHQAQQEKQRLAGLLDALDKGQPIFKPDNQLQALTRQRILSEWGDYQSQLKSVIKEIEQRRSEQDAVRERINQLNGTIPLVSERANSMKQVADKGMVARTQWLELEEERIEQVKERDIQRKQLTSLESAIESLQEKKKSLMANTRATWLQAMSEVEIRLSVYDKEYTKASQRSDLLQLKAPVDGVVKQLAVHTIGGVVTPAQELMQIVPENETLQVEAWIQNKDIGFVSESQEAEIKVDAFPFTKYGLIHGQILNLSDDAIASKEAGLVYSAQVAMDAATIEVNGKPVNLSPGMSVTVEVKTGKRRVIEFLLSPLLRYKSESIRER